MTGIAAPAASALLPVYAPRDVAFLSTHQEAEEAPRLPADPPHEDPRLRLAGADYENIVNCRIFLEDLKNNFPAMNEVYLSYFPNERPTRTTCGVDLQGLGVEIDCIACLD